MFVIFPYVVTCAFVYAIRGFILSYLLSRLYSSQVDRSGVGRVGVRGEGGGEGESSVIALGLIAHVKIATSPSSLEVVIAFITGALIATVRFQVLFCFCYVCFGFSE